MPGTRTGSSDVDPDATEITNVVIENVGGTGTYKDVVYMVPGQDLKCPDSYCVQEVILLARLDSCHLWCACLLMADL